MTKSDAFNFWLESSKDNLATARVMFKAKRWNFTMFMCQQALEALLRAFYIQKKGERPPYIHKIPLLLDSLEIKLPSELDLFAP